MKHRAATYALLTCAFLTGGLTLILLTLSLHRYWLMLLAGALLVTAGAAAFTVVPADAPPALLGAAALAAGLGLGPAMGGITIATQHSVPRADLGSATAASILTKQLGGSVGLAAAQLLTLPPLRVAGWSALVAGLLAFAAVWVMREVPLPVAAADPAKPVDSAAAR